MIFSARYNNARITLALLFVFGFGAMQVQAQTAEIDVEGLPVDPLIGEEFCTETSLTNSAATTGYGPYLVSVIDPGIINPTVDFVDVAPEIDFIGEFGVDDPIVDPISGTPLTGIPGARAYLIRYPIGSVNQGDPGLVLSSCGTLAVGVVIGQPLNITIIPGFEYGDTPTGDNGPEFNTAETYTGIVTPQLARLDKTNTAPENERPPGPDFPFAYEWTVDISDQVTIENLQLIDTLPTTVQWTGDPISVSAAIGVNCQVSTAPNAPTTPGGQAVVTCDSATGTSAEDDLVVTVPVYITDILNESIPDQQPITNTVDFIYEYQGQPYSNNDTSEVLAVHAAIQKHVSGGDLPGDTLTYNMNFQVTDYPLTTGAGASNFVITDILPDGMAFVGTVELLLDGAVVAIIENETAGPGPGQTSLEWDVGAAAGGVITNGSSGVLRYQAEILEYYSDSGLPVSSNDTLTNSAGLNYTLTEGATGNNPSNAPVDVPVNVPEKVILDPPSGVEIMPGQQVTFRLSMAVPAGNTEAVTFVDVLPQPVFDVASSVPTVTVPSGSQFYQPSTLPTVTTSTVNNSVTIDFGDVDTDEGAIVAVDLVATVTDDPYADNLYLTNILAANYTNSNGDPTQTIKAAPLLVGAPKLLLTKGVLQTNNPNATVVPANGGNPAIELIDSDAQNVDAGDTVTFVLTIENIGGQNAYNVLIEDPAVAGLSCNSTPLSVVNGANTALTYSGDLQSGLTLDAPLPGNDDNPAGGGAPFGTDTAIVRMDCTVDPLVQPREELTNTASVVWTATSSATTFFPAVEDDAKLTVASPELAKDFTAITPGYGTSYNASGVQIGELVDYELRITVPEGLSRQVVINDLLDAGLVISDRNNDGTVDASDVTVTLPNLVTSSTVDIQVANEGSGAGENRRLIIDLGDVTNGNSDAATEQIVVTYQTKVINFSNNVNNQQRNNQAEWSWLDSNDGDQSVSISAAPVTILEPQLMITKTMTPSTGDGTSQPIVQLVVKHNGSSTGDAFDISLSDVMPDFNDGSTDYDLLDILPGTVTFDVGCPAFSVSPTATADRIDAAWDVFPLGAECTIGFQTDVLDIIPAGVQITNCADLNWESMNDANQPADQLPLGYERTGIPTDPGQLNDYATSSCASFKILDVGIAKTVASTDQPQTDNISGTPAATESLTIGETVTFDLVVTIPESPVFDLVISDLLPTTEMVLEMEPVDPQTISNGQDIYPVGGSAGDSLVPVISPPEDTNGDGVNDSVSLDFGNIAHVLDGTDDEDRIRIQVTAKVLDRPENANGNLDENTATASYQVAPGGARANKTDTFGIEIVEPLLQVDKTADVTEVEAGDTVTYTLVVSHTSASRIDAEELALSDVLPSDLSLVPGTLDGSQCTAAAQPDSLTESTNSIAASWTEFPFGASCELTFQALVGVTAITGSAITNQADITWTSLQGQGDPDDRNYQASDTWDVLVSLPGLAKVIVATDSVDTPFTLGEPVTQLTIGETVTFLVSASMPDGTTRDVNITDILPTTTRLMVNTTDSQLIRIGSDISMPTGPSVGATPTCTESGSGATTYTEQCEWQLGDVINQPDLRPDPDIEDQIVFRVVATVIDAPENSGVPGVDDNVANVVHLDSPDANLVAQAVFDIVEPLLSLDKVTENGSKMQAVKPLDVHRFTLTVSHTPDSTVNARTIAITDTLDADMLWQGNIVSTCPGLNTTDPGIGFSGNVIFAFDTLPLTQGSCEISFDIQLDGAAVIPGVFPNTASLSWESDPDSVLPASREGDDTSAATLFSISDAFLEKEVVGTSVPGTGNAEGDSAFQDVTIGELVEYRVTAHFTEGTTDDLVLTDVLQNDALGELEFVSGQVLSVGNNIRTEPGAPAISNIGGTITLDYGQVQNDPDGVIDEQDTIVYRLLARVSAAADVNNIDVNVDGDELLNEVDIDFQGVSGSTGNRHAEVLVDVVEPQPALSKAFTSLVDNVATVELVLTNNGTAPAYDAVISDDFNEDVWLAGSVTPVSVPPGFVLTESSDDLMLVTLALDPVSPAVPSPEQVLVPGESVTVTFEVTLRDDRTPADIDQIPNTADAEVSSLPGLHPGVERVYPIQANDTLELPVLALTKAANTATAAPGDTLTYTVALTNSGAGEATDIVITDTPDANGQFQVGTVTVSDPNAAIELGNTPGDTSIRISAPSVAGNTTLEVTYNVIVPLPYPDGSDATAVPQRLVNQAEADSNELPSLLSDGDSATAGTAEQTVVNIIADPIMTIDKDDQTVLAATGETISYLIRYGNAGNQNATGVVITDTVPDNTTFNASASTSGWSCTGNSPGSTCSYPVLAGVPGLDGGSVIFAVDVDSTVPAGVEFINNAVSITEDGQEFDMPDDSPSTDSDTESTPLEVIRTGPELQINKDDGGVTVIPGETYSYDILYANTGNQAATGVVITETVPQYTVFAVSASSAGWSCADGSAAGTTCTFVVGSVPAQQGGAARFGLQVIAPMLSGVDMTENTVLITDDGNNSPLPQTDDDTDDTPILAAPELAIEKMTDTQEAKVDDTIVYDIEYINQGNQDATGVVIREVVPPGSEFSAADSSPTTWNCADKSPAGTVCLYDVGPLAVGDGGTLTFAVTVVNEPNSYRIINVIEINDDFTNGLDPVPGNNIDTVGTPFPSRSIPTMSLGMLTLLTFAMMVFGLFAQRRRA